MTGAAHRRRVLPVGDRALLVECADPAEALALWHRLRAAPPAGVLEPVVAARTVLVRVAEGHLERVRAVLDRPDPPDPHPQDVGAPGTQRRGPAPTGGPEAREVVLETVYDGEDLSAVADLLGTSVEGVVAHHAGTVWTSGFLGFAPGFAYLRAADGWPEVPRLASPRTRVPAGSVAAAGPWSAVYPAASPGGWRLLGRTSTAVWDVDRADPALLPPGTRVRFVPVRGRAVGATAASARDVTDDGAAPVRADGAVPPVRAAPVAAPGRPALEVLQTGPLCLVQDLGRPGHLSLGVPTSGALDRRATVRANRLVGNDRGRAVLEVLLGGLVVRALEDVVVAVTGAPVPLRVARDDHERAVAVGRPFLLPAGAELRLGTPTTGLRTYVALRGGLGGPAVLGSRATDVLSGLGSPPLAVGDVLRLLPPSGTAVAVPPDGMPDGRQDGRDGAHDVATGPEHTVHVVPGPRADWLTPAARASLASHPWEVTDRSNRVGLRLAGPVLERAVTAELPSEGTVPGAVQVPPDGLPVVFLADHPVTGGYPVVAVVRDADLDLLGQVSPGDRVRLVPLGAALRDRP